MIGKDRCSDSARDCGERVPSNCVINGLVSESQGYGRVVCLFYEETSREVEEPLFFEWLTWNQERSLDRIVKSVLELPDSPGGKKCLTLSWTLPSSACVTILGISSE